MIVIGSDCVDCPKELGCIFSACPYYKVVRFVCDECNEESDDLYWFGSDQLCPECALKQLEKVEFED